METTRVCKVCGKEKPINKFEKVRNSQFYSNAGYSRKRTCNQCLYQRYKKRIAQRKKDKRAAARKAREFL